jgi:hypothetical protein
MKKLLKFILPEKTFASVRDETKEWLIACPCGHARDLWDAGGVRYKATGEPRRYLACPKCDRARWHTIRRKTDAEREQLK